MNFWSIHSGEELDLLFKHNGKNYGVEFKYSGAPGMTKSIKSAMADLNIQHLWVVYPGPDRYPISTDITAIPLADSIEL